MTVAEHTMSEDEYTDALLVSIARGRQVDIQIGRDLVGGRWQITATSKTGERWTAADAGYPKAAKLLAESLGYAFNE